MKKEAVVHEEQGGGYWAEAPSPPGCYTHGGTMEEPEENLPDVIALFRSIGISR